MNNEMADDRGKIPNILRIGEISTDSNTMDYDTDVLDPVVNTESFCRFVVPNKGILHSFSKITLCVDTAGGTFPTNIGVNSLIQRATLRVGTAVIAEIDDYNHYQGYKSMFIHNPINLERETYTTSRILNYDNILKNDTGSRSLVNGSGYGLSTDGNYVIAANGITGNLVPIDELFTGNKPVFSIALADLFPMLREHQLPLYLINEQISIELHFVSAASLKRCIYDKEAGGATGTLFTMDTTETKLIADYLYYTDGDIMARFQQQNMSTPISYDYPDYRLNKRTFTQAQLQGLTTLDIGGAGRVVRKVITALESNLAEPDSSLTNVYSSFSPATATNNVQLFTTNCVFNDQRLYPVDRSNPSVHYYDLVRAEMNIPAITRAEWSKEGVAGGFTEGYEYLGFSQGSSTEGYLGKFFYIVYDVGSANQRINSRGIQLELKYGATLAGTFTHRAWVELEKTATLQAGMFRTFLK